MAERSTGPRALTPGEELIVHAVDLQLRDLAQVNLSPSYVVVHRTEFLGIGRILGLPIIRAGYILPGEVAVLVMARNKSGAVPQ